MLTSAVLSLLSQGVTYSDVKDRGFGSAAKITGLTKATFLDNVHQNAGDFFRSLAEGS